MNAAIYARKSTEQNGVATEAKSVTRQKELALAFALSKGWTVDDAHVFEDDGISGAEFERRPGLQRLLAAARRGEFGVLVVSEQKSLGREQFGTGTLMKELAECSVEVLEYVHGQSLTPKNYLDKAMFAVRSIGDEAHREQTSERVHESHAAKHQRGHVVGGRVFGYRNVDVFAADPDAHGRPLRLHVKREVNQEEAAVVERIFELYASGLGLKAIAKLLTKEGAPAPKPFVRKDPTKVLPNRGWSPSTVRAILGRDDYRGVYVWNRTQKRTPVWGKVKQRKRLPSEWQRTNIDEWRIISDDLWNRVRSRRQEVENTAVRFSSGRISGRPPRHGVNNLLAGLATCALCGGGLVVETSRVKAGRTSAYVCFRHRTSVCVNALRVRVDVMNEAVLQAVEEHALTPEAIEQVILTTERDDARDQQTTLERERKDVEKRITRLVGAIEDGGEVASLKARIRELEDRKVAIARELAELRPVPRLAPAVIEDRLAEWRRLLRQSVTQGRAVLQRVLKGRILFTPTPDGYTFEAPTRFDKLFAGMAVPVPVGWHGDTRGTEDISPEDTFDADYGALLERAQAGHGRHRAVEQKGMASPAGTTPLVAQKGMASPQGFEPWFQP